MSWLIAHRLTYAVFDPRIRYDWGNPRFLKSIKRRATRRREINRIVHLYPGMVAGLIVMLVFVILAFWRMVAPYDPIHHRTASNNRPAPSICSAQITWGATS